MKAVIVIGRGAVFGIIISMEWMSIVLVVVTIIFTMLLTDVPINACWVC